MHPAKYIRRGKFPPAEQDALVAIPTTLDTPYVGSEVIVIKMLSVKISLWNVLRMRSYPGLRRLPKLVTSGGEDGRLPADEFDRLNYILKSL